ncbi:MAG: outer membrane beta-barrel protein [Pseudomonadota bacterium]
MDRFIKLIAALAIVFGFSHSAFAGIHIEPFLGYSVSGNYESDFGSTTDGDYVSDGPQIGARVGYGMLGFFGALEYEMSSMTADGDDDSSIDQTLLGVSVGYEFPILIRGYATYIFSADGKSDDDFDSEFKGTGVKLGVGYTGLPFVAINFEMTQLNFNDYESNSNAADDAFESFDATYYTISVSLPLDLL